MMLKPVNAMIAIAGIGLILFAGSCSERRDSAASKAETANNAASDGKKQPVEFSLSARDDEGFDLSEREEIRRSYRLAPESKVSINNINGRVKVEMADTDLAEVLVVRSARKREELEYGMVSIELDDGVIYVNVEGDRKSAFSSLGSVPEVRQRVIVKLPRTAGLDAYHTDGEIAVGEIRGRLKVVGTGGSVRIARAAGPIELRDINGGVDVSLAPLAGNGVEINNVNGDVVLRFEGEVNADVNAWRINGNITPDLPNIEKLPAEPSAGRMKARIGRGGAKIEIHNINGNLVLRK
jgi:DUF4097 and DUF4098 domain-containing protein YvlB